VAVEPAESATRPVLPSRYALADQPALGEGGMGQVWLARDTVLDVWVALKLVRPELASDERFSKLFSLEIGLSARLTHPRLVPIHDSGLLPDGTPYLGLAYADAGNFAQFRDGDLQWEPLLDLVFELLDALAFLHARGVLHRDLKPENVLLHRGEEGRLHVWLADLGLAGATDDLARRKGRREGTPGFMAPEQRRGAPQEYGPWTDLFALGVILWEIVTGSRPFSEEEGVEQGLAAFEARGPVPSDLERVLRQLLSVDPLSRYDLVADLRVELTRLGPAEARTGSSAPGDASEAAPAGETGASRWNRPVPVAMPEVPPLPSGLGARARASLPLFALRELPLVARDDARAALWAEARAVAADGRPRVVLLVGEAGSGKTSLAASVLRDLEVGGWSQWVGLTYHRPPGPDDGYDGAARALLRPWNETAASARARWSRALTRERAEGAEEVAAETERLVRWAGLGGEEPVAAGYGLRTVYRWLDARAWRSLATLFIDDAHAAVEEGEGLAIADAVLAGREAEGRRPLLVVCALRSEELAASPALASHVAALVAAGARRLDVPRLDREGTRALLHEALTLTPGLVERLAERCEGNPLFARQLLLEWSQRGWLVDEGRLVFGLAPGVNPDEALPRDAAGLVDARVARLAEASGDAVAFSDLVHTAALAGRSLPRDLLLDDLAPSGLREFALGCGLWVADGETVRFDGALLHQALEVAAARRLDLQELHGGLVAAWSDWSERVATPADAPIARHALAAGWPDRALPALRAAAVAAWRRGRARELEEVARQLVGVARGLGDAGAEGVGALWWGRALDAQGRPLDAAAQLAIARGSLPSGGEQVEATLAWCEAQLRVGDLRAARGAASEAMELAKSRKDLRLEGLAVLAQAACEQVQRNVDGADLLYTRAEARLAQVSDARGVALALLGRAGLSRRRGDWGEAEEGFDEAAAAFVALGDPLSACRARAARAEVLACTERADEAESALRLVIAEAEDLGAMAVAMEARLTLADVLRRGEGPSGRAVGLYEAQLAWAERQRLSDAVAAGALGAAHLALDEGDLESARALEARARAGLARTPSHFLWAPVQLLTARLRAHDRDERATFQALWSASELGLGDLVHPDTAQGLHDLARLARGRGWPNVLKVAGKLAVSQFERLGERDTAADVQGWLAG
jgi:hypothetical protein